jgi:dCMP deaminase
MLESDHYYMNLAVAASARANCTGRKVGAVLVANDRVISTGYNGTPSNFRNCKDGGCWRCRQAKDNEELKGQKYDLCICVHAEQNALLTAAREGIHTRGTTVYTTLKPCFGCVKEALQAGVERIVYLRELGAYEEEDHLAEQYRELADHLPISMEKIEGHLPGWPDEAVGQPTP